MYKLKLSIQFLLISLCSFGQTYLSDEEQKLIAEKEFIQLANQHKNNKLTSSSFVKSNTQFVMNDDLDDDGMDDNWETTNGLDPNNPKDAWADADNDLILNLFEFQLETDPNDESSPAVFELSPIAGASVLDDMIEAAENSIRVIRLAQGNYDGNVLAVFNQNFKIMIQGGWNENFTEHNPGLYPTNWNGLNDEALAILVPDNNPVTNSTIILEGVNFMASDYFSLAGPVWLTNNSGYSATSIYNCTFNTNPFYGLSLGHRAQSDSAQVFIVNTVIGNNSSGGIYTQVTNGTKVRWRLFNTTINNPESEEGGIDGLTSGQGELKIELTNCINWGNTNYSFNFSSFHNVQITTINSNLDQARPSLDISDLANSINTNPLFQNVMANDWTLTDNSPCIDTGVDIGLPFNGTAPDMGALEALIVNKTEEINSFEKLNISPNPFTNNFSIEIIDEVILEEAEIKIYDLLGKCLHTEKRLISGKLKIETEYLPEGLFILNLKINEKQYSAKILKN